MTPEIHQSPPTKFNAATEDLYLIEGAERILHANDGGMGKWGQL